MKTTTKILIGILIISMILVCGCEKQLTPPPLPEEEGMQETSSNPPAEGISETGEMPAPPALPAD